MAESIAREASAVRESGDEKDEHEMSMKAVSLSLRLVSLSLRLKRVRSATMKRKITRKFCPINQIRRYWMKFLRQSYIGRTSLLR